MTLLVDTDVVLDLLLDRVPHSSAAANLISRIETGRLSGYLCATTVTAIHYLLAKGLGRRRAHEEVRKLLAVFDVAPVNRVVLEAALQSTFPDFEVGVINAAAEHVAADALVTRDTEGFRKATMPVYAPAELLGVFRAEENDRES